MTEPVNRGSRVLSEVNYIHRLKMEIVNSVLRNAETGCHEWTKSFQRNGYAQKRAFGKMMPAHRASWLAFKGEIPKGTEIAHCCGNRKCVNPDHLKAITHSENMREMALMGNCKRRKIFIKGNEYPSVAIAANKLGIARSSVRYQEKRQQEVM